MAFLSTRFKLSNNNYTYTRHQKFTSRFQYNINKLKLLWGIVQFCDMRIGNYIPTWNNKHGCLLWILTKVLSFFLDQPFSVALLPISDNAGPQLSSSLPCSWLLASKTTLSLVRVAIWLMILALQFDKALVRTNSANHLHYIKRYWAMRISSIAYDWLRQSLLFC